MNRRQKEVLLRQFESEEAFLKDLEKIYAKALEEINDKIKILQASDMQSKIYQRKFQEALKGQLETILELLHSQECSKIEEYLDNCYRDAFIGALYDLQGQHVPLIIPINQEQVVKALQLDSQISEGLYKRLGEPFEVAGKKAMYPGNFGDPSEDCNCRCALLQRAKWNLGVDETKYLGKIDDLSDEDLQWIVDKLNMPVSELRKYSGQIIPVKAKKYEDFKNKYEKVFYH